MAKQIATITRPNRWNNKWYAVIGNEDGTQVGTECNTRAEAVSTLRQSETTILSNREFNNEMNYRAQVARRNSTVWHQYCD